MSDSFNHLDPASLPPDELSPLEQRLLRAHLDAERVARWNKIAGRERPGLSLFLKKNRWAGWAVAAGLALAVCWTAGLFSGGNDVASPAVAMAVDYPFEPSAVRGAAVETGFERSKQAIAAYQSGDFRRALEAAAPADRFFRGMCFLKMGNAAAALAEWDRMDAATEAVGDEAFYFRGLALESLGRREEARQAFQKVLDSKTVREPYREATRRCLWGSLKTGRTRKH